MKKGMTLSICGKTSDLCSATLTDADGKVLKEKDGYVPEMMPGEHYGDYIIIDIDIETGKILNWKKPSKKAIDAFIKTGH
jgi:hypothetical protein